MTEQTKTPLRRKSPSALAESFMVRYGFKFMLGFVIIICFLTAVQCTIKKPESPQWSTTLSMPIMNRVYMMPEIVEKIDQPGLDFNDSGEVYFTYSEDIEAISIDDELETSDISTSIIQVLGAVDITVNPPPPIVLNLGDLVTPIGDQIPAGSFNTYRDLDPIDNFSWATFASGGFYIIIQNDLGINLNVVMVDVFDRVTSTAIIPSAVTFPGGIDIGEKDSVFISLGGKTINNWLGLDIYCETPGGTVLSLGDKNMSSAVSFGTLTVIAAEAEVPQITKDLTTIVAISDDNTIHSAQLISGDAQLTIQNGTNLESNVTIQLSDFNLDGTPLSRTLQMRGGMDTTFNIDLTGYTFEPGDITAPQDIAIEVTANILATTPDQIIIDENDDIRFSANVTNLTFSSLTGILDETDASFDNIDPLEVDLPMGFDQLQLVNAEMTLEILNTAELSGALSLTVSGDNGKNHVISGIIAAGSQDNPVLTTLVDDDIADFLNPVPSVITVSGAATFGGGVDPLTIHLGDSISASVTITSPLEVVIGDASFEGDISDEEIDQDDIDIVTDHFISAELRSVITNHLPLGASVEILLGPDSSTLYTNPQLRIGPLTVDAGVVGAGNTVVDSTVSENIIVLDSLDIKILENDTLYIGQLITLEDTDGQPIKIISTDYIRSYANIVIEYLFDGEF